MPRRTIPHGAITYTIADDDPARSDLLSWAVLRVRALDELTLEPPRVPIVLRTKLRAMTPRRASGGICGFVARPRDVSQALVTPGAFTASLEGPDYLPRDLTPAIDAARRTLPAGSGPNATTLAVAAPDPAPRQQFRPGRGVMVERPAGTLPEDFSTVELTSPPPLPADVPLTIPIAQPRAVNARVASIPLVLPDQLLHRATPIRLRGRVQRRIGPPPFTLVPAAGAMLGLVGVWWTFGSSTTAAPLPPDVCAVEPGLRFSHPTGASIESCTINLIGPARRLLDVAPLDSRELRIQPNVGLNPAGGNLLSLGDLLTAENEVVVTAGFTAPADPSAPVLVRLTAPTGFLYRAGAVVRDVDSTPLALGLAPVSAIAREAQVGDRVLFGAGLAAAALTSTIAVEPATARAAFYRATQYPTLPNLHQVPINGEGRFEWPLLARVAQVRIVARRPPHPQRQLDIALNYGGDSDNTVSIVFM